MIQLILEEPYQFIPPCRGNLWPSLLKHAIPWYLNKNWGVSQVEHHGLELVRESLKQGKSVILAPNHSRLSDPFVLGTLAKPLNRYFYLMASWHLFKSSWMQGFLMRRLGAYSIYREGTDKASLQETVSNLVKADRITILFPEGILTRTNDFVFPLREGLAFVARMAAKRLAESGRELVVHPVGVRYHFHGELEASGNAVLSKLESKFLPQGEVAPALPLDSAVLSPSPDCPADLPSETLHGRYARLGLHVLAERERQFLGAVQTGCLASRLNRLANALLEPLESQPHSALATTADASAAIADISDRVKQLRQTLVPDLARGKLSTADKAERWKQLERVYFAQQLTRYRADDALPHRRERLLEAIERLEEDLTDRTTAHRTWTAKVGIGPALSVPKDKSLAADQEFSHRLRQEMQSLLDRLTPPAG